MIKTQSKLTRTAGQPPFPAGKQKGVIVSLEVKEMKSSYSATGMRDAANVKLRLKQPNGEESYVYYASSLTWSPKGKFMKMLVDLDAVPAINEELNVEALIGVEVNTFNENQ